MDLKSLNSEDAVIALIDAQDNASIASLREFLSKYALQVLVNQETNKNPVYQIIVGETEFVKRIISLRRYGNCQRLLICFNSKENDVNFIADSQTKVVLLESYSLDDNLVRKILQFFFTSSERLLDLSNKNRENRIKEIIKTTYALKPNFELRHYFEKWQIWLQLNKFKKIVIVVTLSVIIPLVWYLSLLGLSASCFLVETFLLRRGLLDLTKKTTQTNRFSLTYGKATLKFFAPGFKLIRQNQLLQEQEQLLNLAFAGNEMIEKSLVLINRSKSLGKAILGNLTKPGLANPADSLTRLRIDATALQDSLGLVYAQWEKAKADNSLVIYFNQRTQFDERIDQYLSKGRETMQNLDRLLNLYPLIGGFKDKKNYLVILQNNLELRPTGGFIGSIALVTLVDGAVGEIKVEDVYTLDGQLNGHVDPPRPIRELLEQEHWYLRDSNWDPNFAKSAQSAKWFYQKETGQSIDGVIGLTGQFVVDLLQITGPLDLSDFNERITASNFLGKAYFYAQTDFFPGSTQKKDFLGTLTTAIFEKLKTTNLNNLEMFQLINRGFSTKNIQLYFNDSEAQLLTMSAGWAGGLPTQDQCQEVLNCFTGNLILNEANLGVNKVNYFIERQATAKINLTNPAKISTELNLIYFNNYNNEDQLSGGVYRNYLRLFLPLNSVVTSLKINNQSIGERPPIPYAEEEITDQYRVLGIALEVFPKQQLQLNLVYDQELGNELSGKQFTYDTTIYHQPGLLKENWKLNFRFPPTWRLADEQYEALLVNPGLLEYNSNLLQDQHLRLEFKTDF